MAIFSNVSGTWKKVSKVFNNVSGTWREVKKAFTNVGGTWKQVHSGAAELTITGNQFMGRALTLADLFDATTIANNTDFIITVPAGITLATTTGVPVFDFSGVTGKNITIINNGTIKAGTTPDVNYFCRYMGSTHNPCSGTIISNFPTSVTDSGWSWSTDNSQVAYCDNGWTLYSTTPVTSVPAIIYGSNTVTISGNAAVAGSIGVVRYYHDKYGGIRLSSCCNCGGTSG